jgi:hypothetical protein
MSDRCAISPTAVEKQWGRTAAFKADYGNECISAAAWRIADNAPEEIVLEPDSAVHILIPVLWGKVGKRELWIDGKRRHTQASFSACQFSLIRAGESPRSTNAETNALRVHIYLPDSALRLTIDDDCERQGF